MPLRSIHKPPIARIKTGSYTGDGTTSQSITGIGFKPKHVIVWVDVAGTRRHIFVMMDQMAPNRSFYHHFRGGHYAGITDRITSLDTDGFTVDDAGADADPNKNAQNYFYLALG